MTLYELLESALTTSEQRADGSLAPLLARSRRAPMRSSVKRYGAFLGVDPEQAGPEQYHLPAHEIHALVDRYAPDTLAANSRRNIGNDIIHLCRLGVDQGWIAALPAPLLSWRDRLPDPKHHHIPLTEEMIARTPYALTLAECPPALQDALTGYLRWCEAPVARHRDHKIIKRPVTSRDVQGSFLRLAGFAVHWMHQPIETLTLDSLTQMDFLEAHVNWWITNRRGQMSHGLHKHLVHAATICRHWLKNEARAQEIEQLYNGLPPMETYSHKELHWLSLAQLEKIGLSVHPFNARRVQEYPHLRQAAGLHGRTRRHFGLAWHVEMSLMLRLLLRLPMRQRCLREMVFGRNLYQDHDGRWQVRFVGAELKIDRVHGAVNRYEFPFPDDLVPLLDEWRQEWRPLIAAPDEDHVFLSRRGKPIRGTNPLSKAFTRVTYRFSGVAVNPHLIRDIWATEYLNQTGDIAGCARRLGNTIQVVMQCYAHILKKDVDARAESFMSGIFANGNGTSR